MSKKKFGPKKIWAKKFLGAKENWVEKNVVQEVKIKKRLRSKQILDPKQFWVRKI